MLILCLLGSALLFYSAFPNIIMSQGVFIGGWLFAIPFLFALEKLSPGRRFCAGLFFGAVSYGCLVHWLAPISLWGYGLFVLVLSLQPVVFSWLAVSSCLPDEWRLLYYPSLWVASEAVRTLVMGGFSWSLAYSQAFHPVLIQTAAWGSTASVAWIMFFVSTAVFVWIKGGFRKKRFLILGFLGFLVNAALGWGILNRPDVVGEKVRVHAVQPNISRADKVKETLYHQNALTHLALTQESMILDRPDLVVWPETAFPDDILTDPLWRPRMERAARDWRVHVLFGSALLREGQDRNSALLVSPAGAWIGIYDKKHLVPLSEYQPADFLLRYLIQGKVQREYDFKPGQSPGIFFMDRMIQGKMMSESFGVAICSEEAYPSVFSDLAARGAGFLVVMLNDGWFVHHQALMMHGQMGIFRALETARPLVRASNTGWSVAFDAQGRRIPAHEPGLGRSGFLSADLIPARGQSLYVKFGDFFAIACVGFVIMTLLMVMMGRKKENPYGK